MKVYSSDAKVRVNIDVDGSIVTFIVKPLTFEQKKRFGSEVVNAGDDSFAQSDVIMKIIKCCLHDIEGITDENDKPWKVERKNGECDNKTIDMISNIPEFSGLYIAVAKMIHAIPTGVLTDEKGKEIKGITVEVGK